MTHSTFLLHPGTNDDMIYRNVVERTNIARNFLSCSAPWLYRSHVGEYPELRADELPRHVRVRGLGPFTIDVLAAHLARSGSAVTLEPQATAQSGAPGAVLRRSKIAARVN